MDGEPPPIVSRSKVQNKILAEKVGRFTCVELTGHAIDRMKVRGLTEADVLITLREPDERGLGNGPDRKRVRRIKTARVAVDVIYMELGNRLLVITVIRINRRLSGRTRK